MEIHETGDPELWEEVGRDSRLIRLNASRHRTLKSPSQTNIVLRMLPHEFFDDLEKRIAKYSLLSHTFYQAWSAGELTRDDLREYARDYYHHVAAFPTYLAAFAERLPNGQLRDAVLVNMLDELGGRGQPESGPHAELWLDFCEGMGGTREASQQQPPPEINNLIAHFRSVAASGTEEEALAAFYAYESQVPRIAAEKEQGLRACYGADDRTCRYFTLHAVADVHHASVWREQLSELIQGDAARQFAALEAAEITGKALWRALDGFEERRQARKAA